MTNVWNEKSPVQKDGAKLCTQRLSIGMQRSLGAYITPSCGIA